MMVARSGSKLFAGGVGVVVGLVLSTVVFTLPRTIDYSIRPVGSSETKVQTNDTIHDEAVVLPEFSDKTHYGCIIKLLQPNGPHFPHAYQQWILPCWNWVRHQQEIVNGTCGFYMNATSVPMYELQKFKKSDWNREMIVTLMQCSITYFENMFDLTQNPVHTLYKVPTPPTTPWILPHRNTALLRQRLIQQVHLNDTTDSAGSVIRIGLVNRKGTRHIVNFPDLTQALYNHSNVTGKKLSITSCEMEGMSTLQQFIYWASQDIIVTPHGAAVTTATVMQPGSALVELYPEHYYPPYFDGLLQQIGVHHYPYYNGVEDPLADTRKHWEERVRWRGVKTMEPNFEAMLQLVMNAIEDISALRK